MSSKMPWVDILKGIGIVFVVYGHFYSGTLRDAIFLFHMPLFFILSGYLFKPRSQLVEYAGSKASHLLVPYFSFLIIIYLVMLGHAFVNGGVSLEMAWKSITDILLGGRALDGDLSAFWFVTCLFLSQQMVNVLVNRLRQCWVVAILMLCVVVGYLNQYVARAIWLPWNANVVVIAAPFFYLGYCIRMLSYSWNGAWVQSMAWGVSVLGMIAMGLAPELMRVDMKYALYGLPLAGLLVAIAMTTILAGIAEAMAGSRTLQALLGPLGRASMTIMFLHYPLQGVWRSYLPTSGLIGVLGMGMSLLFPWLMHWLLNKTWLTQRLFLGSGGNRTGRSHQMPLPVA